MKILIIVSSLVGIICYGIYSNSLIPKFTDEQMKTICIEECIYDIKE